MKMKEMSINKLGLKPLLKKMYEAVLFYNILDFTMLKFPLRYSEWAHPDQNGLY